MESIKRVKKFRQMDLLVQVGLISAAFERYFFQNET